jgi:hypothetical protein
MIPDESAGEENTDHDFGPGGPGRGLWTKKRGVAVVLEATALKTSGF